MVGRQAERADPCTSSLQCEAAFRNAGSGLLWARISHVDQAIRVDLDLSPHTTLSKAGRDYQHNCFYLPGVTLPKGSYIGVSGLAAGNTEPDAIDIYAMDVFEVAKVAAGETAPADTGEPPLEVKHTGPLEGTSDNPVGTLAQEIFLSQAKIMEAIDALTVRLESLTRTVESGAGSAAHAAPAGPDPNLAQSLAHIDNRLNELTVSHQATRDGHVVVQPVDHSDSLAHLVQLQDRLMVEIKAVARKLDNANVSRWTR